MTNPAGGVPTPEQNRAAWKAAHPDAAEVSQDEAAAKVADHLGGAAPSPGVSGDSLGAQMAAAGAQAGLPHEDAMDALMEQIKALSDQVGELRHRDQQREQAAILALGEPILQRYANGLRDKLRAHVDANPGSGEHFRQAVSTATALADAASTAISRGANDMSQVNHHAAWLDRFLERGHKRTAPGHLKHLDLGSVASDLEALIDESYRLSPGMPAQPPPAGKMLTGAVVG